MKNKKLKIQRKKIIYSGNIFTHIISGLCVLVSAIISIYNLIEFVNRNCRSCLFLMIIGIILTVNSLTSLKYNSEEKRIEWEDLDFFDEDDYRIVEVKTNGK